MQSIFLGEIKWLEPTSKNHFGLKDDEREMKFSLLLLSKLLLVQLTSIQCSLI
jgi:hypothetical protein